MVRKKEISKELVEEVEVLQGIDEDNLTKESISSSNFSKEEKVLAEELNADLTNFFSKTLKIEPDKETSPILLPTGIDYLDVILGGGITTGLVEVAGAPGCGKSSLGGRIISNGQLKYPGKFMAVYLDSEVATTCDRLKQLGVVNPPINPYNDEITVERVFHVLESLCVYKEKNKDLMNIPSIIVWDSVANTVSAKAMEVENPEQVLGKRAAMLSHLIPKYISKLRKYKITLLAINQVRDKIDMGIIKKANTLKKIGDKNIPGGFTLHHNASQFLYFKQGSMMDNYGFTGNKVTATAIKNKTFSPFIDISLIFSFRNGFNNFWTNFELLKTYKRVESGAWCSVLGYSGSNFRQIQALEKYKTEPEFKEVFDDHVKDILKTEYTDKYQPANE